MGTWIPDQVFTCNPQFYVATVALVLMCNQLEAYEAAHSHTTDDAIVCDPVDTDFHGLVTAMLKEMGVISLVMPFNRACYPLPSGDALIIDL